MANSIHSPLGLWRSLGRLKSCCGLLAAGLALLSLAACSSGPVDTGLFGKAQHTGTMTILRVDDGWHSDPKQRAEYLLGEGFLDENGKLRKDLSRFVPLREKAAVKGLDGPNRIVTKDDDVTVTLKSAFVKYFKEASLSGVAKSLFGGSGGDKRRGEIALVLSFDDGKELKENRLIYASQGQTLGSFLSLQDWPMIGPVKLEGDSLLVRLVMIELDGKENEQTRQIVQFLTTVGAAAVPQGGPIFKIGQEVANFLIGLNSDDVVLDQRFSFHLVEPGKPVTRNPLLFGKYVLVLQEDRLRGDDVTRVAPSSVNPVVPSDMRFDRHSEGLFKVYNYRRNYIGTDGSVFPGKGPIDWGKAYFWDTPDDEYGKPDFNDQASKDVRKNVLGYQRPELSVLELFDNMDSALRQALSEACRTGPAEEATEATAENLCNRKLTEDGAMPFEYRVTQYPEGHTVLAAYPLHTHLVLSVDRSLGGDRRFDQQFQDFQAFLDAEKSAAAGSGLVELGNALDRAVTEKKRRNVLFSKASKIGSDLPGQSVKAAQKACLLWSEGLFADDGKELEDALLSKPIYNELFHITGEVFDKPGQVEAYLSGKMCNPDKAKRTCSCPK